MDLQVTPQQLCRLLMNITKAITFSIWFIADFELRSGKETIRCEGKCFPTIMASRLVGFLNNNKRDAWICYFLYPNVVLVLSTTTPHGDSTTTTPPGDRSTSDFTTSTPPTDGYYQGHNGKPICFLLKSYGLERKRSILYFFLHAQIEFIVLGVNTLAVGVGVTGGILVLLVPLVVFIYIKYRGSTNQNRQRPVYLSL